MKRKSKEIVAERLDQLMKQTPHLGTQMKLANKTGIGQTTIGRIRRGEVNATAENLRAIADAFDVPVGYLYGEETVHGIRVDMDIRQPSPAPKRTMGTDSRLFWASSRQNRTAPAHLMGSGR